MPMDQLRLYITVIDTRIGMVVFGWSVCALVCIYVTSSRSLEEKVLHASKFRSFEINNIPMFERENLYRIVVALGKVVGITRYHTIQKAFRYPQVRRRQRFTKEKPPPIIVVMNNREDKELWLARCKLFPNKTADMLDPDFPRQTVFVNEYLLPFKKKLLVETKKTAKKLGFDHVWTRDTDIYVRRSFKERPIMIKEWKDLTKLNETYPEDYYYYEYPTNEQYQQYQQYPTYDGDSTKKT